MFYRFNTRLGRDVLTAEGSYAVTLRDTVLVSIQTTNLVKERAWIYMDSSENKAEVTYSQITLAYALVAVAATRLLLHQRH